MNKVTYVGLDVHKDTRAVEKYAIERVNRQMMDLLGLDAEESSHR